MDFRFLGLSIEDGVARVVLRRPPLNVLHMEMVEELGRALGAVADAEAVRVLVLSAEGKAFSAGVSVEDHLPDKVRPMLTSFHVLFRRLWALPCPTLAVVQGAALGGGCELACACDRVLAAEGATLGVPEIKLASFPPVAAVYFPYRVGVARTLQLITSGEVLPAREAERIGLADRVVEGGALPGAVEEEVARLREKSAVALRLARRAVYAGLGREPQAALDEAERLFLEELMATADAVEGLQAFLQKRPPAWSHR